MTVMLSGAKFNSQQTLQRIIYTSSVTGPGYSEDYLSYYAGLWDGKNNTAEWEVRKKETWQERGEANSSADTHFLVHWLCNCIPKKEKASFTVKLIRSLKCSNKSS